jgi:hypothetical protein
MEWLCGGVWCVAIVDPRTRQLIRQWPAELIAEWQQQLPTAGKKRQSAAVQFSAMRNSPILFFPFFCVLTLSSRVS